MSTLKYSECLWFAVCLFRWVNGRMVPCLWSTTCGLAMNFMGLQPGRMTTCPSSHWRRHRSSLWKMWILLVGPVWGTLYPVGSRSKQGETESPSATVTSCCSSERPSLSRNWIILLVRDVNFQRNLYKTRGAISSHFISVRVTVPDKPNHDYN